MTYIIVASSDANSTISPSGSVVVNPGENQSFSISANSGYYITHVYVDSVDQGKSRSFTFYNVAANHTISVTSVLTTEIEITGNLAVAMTGNKIVLPDTAPILSNAEIVAEVYGWNDIYWQPYLNPRDDGVAQFIRDTSNLVTFKDTSGKEANIFAINSPNDGARTLLAVDSGFVVKKDFHAGGVLSCDQGAILLGHGLVNSTDPPKISLTHSDAVWTSGESFPTSDLYFGQLFYLTQEYQGYSAGYYYYGTDSTWHVGSGTACPSSPSPYNEQKFIRTDFNPYRLYEYFNGSWSSLGSIQNWNGGYDTLHITKRDGTTPGHLDIGNLLVNGVLTFNNSSNIITLYSGYNSPTEKYLYPSDIYVGLGSVGHPFLYVDTTYLNTDNIKAFSGSTISVLNTLAFGNNPFTISSTSVISNLNADKLDGYDAASFVTSGAAASFSGISMSGNIIPTVAGTSSTGYYCGSASYPWQIVDTYYLYANTLNALSGSTINVAANIALGSNTLTTSNSTVVSNLNADKLDGYDASSFLLTANQYITSVTSPLQVSSKVLSILQATSSQSGYLSSTDWSTFNSKYGSGSAPSFSGISMSGHIIPTVAGTSSTGYYCGSSSYPWRIVDTYYLYANTINALSGSTVNVACTLAFGSNTFTTSNATVVTNLNADKLDGYHASSFVTSGSAPSFTGISMGGNIIPTVAGTSSTGYYCGSASYPWRIVDTYYLYANTLNALSGTTINVANLKFLQSQDQLQFSPSGYNSAIWAYKPSESKLFGLWDGSSWRFYIDTSGNLQCTCNIYPASANNGNIGTNTNYWGAVWANYLCYHTSYAYYFDEYDDLALVKLWGEKTKTLPENYDATKTKPPANDPFAILKSTTEQGETAGDFFHVEKMQSFALGCAKALAIKQEEQEQTIAALYDEIEKLQEEVLALKTK